MSIFILKHPSKDFSGNVYGVSFDNGVGSTSSQRDANFCIQKHGCEDVTAKYEKKQVDKDNPAAVNYVLKSKKKDKKKDKEKEEDQEEAPAEKKK